MNIPPSATLALNKKPLEPEKPKVLKITVAMFIYGGADPNTMQCYLRDSLYHSQDPDMSYELHFTQHYNDALIDRARSTVAEYFLKTGDDVLVMVDHDLSWNQGDLLRIARKAHEKNGIVGAAISKRNKNEGIASRIIENGIFNVPSDRVVLADYVGSAFTAYSRPCVEAVWKMTRPTFQGFRPTFLPAVCPYPQDPSVDWYLSEDWAFCRRALDLGFKCYLDLLPVIGHWGVYCYTVGDAHSNLKREDFQRPPRFSLLHATRGRPEQAMEIRKLWLDRASGFHPIEYIYSVDSDDPKPLPKDNVPDGTIIIEGENRGNCDAYNRACYSASGEIFIQVHDDVIPPIGWDTEIIKYLGEGEDMKVLKVNDGLPPSVNSKPDLIPILIGTRKWFESIGYFYHPSIVSVFCDDHAGLMAKHHGVVVHAPDLVFHHNWEGPMRDETQQRSYRQENWAIGEKALTALVKGGLKKEPHLWGHDIYHPVKIEEKKNVKGPGTKAQNRQGKSRKK